MDFNFQDFTNQKFNDLTLDQFPDTITGTCFYQENTDTDKAVVDFSIFPSAISCTFIRCNMTNVKKHPGMTYIDCQEETICVQADMEDWHTDNGGNPVEPKDKHDFIELGISTDPAHIVNTGGIDRVTKETRRQLEG
jgi:hypothetical protein